MISEIYNESSCLFLPDVTRRGFFSYFFPHVITVVFGPRRHSKRDTVVGPELASASARAFESGVIILSLPLSERICSLEKFKRSGEGGNTSIEQLRSVLRVLLDLATG